MKVKRLRRRPQTKSRRARLSVDCSANERKYIKMLAARQDKTISEYLIGLAKKEMPRCTHRHIPNKETVAALDASEKGEDVEKIEDLEKFWKSMGL